MIVQGSSNAVGDAVADGDGAEDEEPLVVCQSHFRTALDNLTPSLSQEELARYQAIKQLYDAQQGFGDRG